MPYREALPSPLFESWIECYWTRSGAAPEVDRVLPDGCADVIFDLGRFDAFAVGTMTRPLFVPAASRSELFGIRFRPGRASLGIHVPLSELTDRSVPLRDLRSMSTGLTDALADAKTFEARVAVTERFLRHALESFAPDAVVDHAIDVILRSHGSVPIDSIAASLSTSRQRLARRFDAAVGVSPKMFARVVRFRHVLREVVVPAVDWSDIALSAGYFDQSHLIADFRQFTGTTPVPFFLSRETPGA
ncbi:MAG: AraC family transcriptional regulator [Thermoanaerobaculia bacterium]